MKTILLMDIVIAAFGLYLVFVALGMKRNGCRSDRHSRGSESPVTGKGVEFY